MQLGKREQITLGVIITIVVIGMMHFVLFAPAIKRFKDAKGAYDLQVNEIKNLQTIQNLALLTSLTQQTERNIAVLTSGTKILQLEDNKLFVPVPVFNESIKGELDATKPQNMTPEEFGPIRDAAQAQRITLWVTEQTTTLLQQVERLQSFATSQNPKMSFLGPTGWNLPTALPPAMQTAQLWDVIKIIEERKGTLKAVTKGSSAYNTILGQYNAYLYQIGLNVNIARNLRRFGEHVPIYYRMAVLQLILKQMPKDRPIIIHESELNLARLMVLLEIDFGLDAIPGMTANKWYFAYENLRQINNLLSMAQEFQLLDVTNITIFPYGLLRQQAEFKMASDTIVDPRQLRDDQVYLPDASAEGAAAPGLGMLPGPGGMLPAAMMQHGGLPPGPMPGGGDPAAGGEAPAEGLQNQMAGMMGRFNPNASAPAAPAEDIGKPKEGEIGIGLPIRITFQSENMRGWNFMHSVLKRQPLVEMNRLGLRALSLQDVNNTNIEATVTYIFVPKLFETIDAVQRVLQDIRAGRSGAAPGPPSPAANLNAPAP